MEIRIGQGFDIHPLEEGGPLFLGCVQIPEDLHLKAHSDGDVVAHSIADALLGPLGLSLGDVFLPDERNKGRKGASILEEVCGILSQRGWEIVNVDVSVIGDRPRLRPWQDIMQTAVARALKTEAARINIRPRHMEGLGIGSKGLAALAVVLIRRIEDG